MPGPFLGLIHLGIILAVAFLRWILPLAFLVLLLLLLLIMMPHGFL
jgi:hypothetical protein